MTFLFRIRFGHTFGADRRLNIHSTDQVNTNSPNQCIRPNGMATDSTPRSYAENESRATPGNGASHGLFGYRLEVRGTGVCIQISKVKIYTSKLIGQARRVSIPFGRAGPNLSCAGNKRVSRLFVKSHKRTTHRTFTNFH
jgi:hypothetical protein